VATTNYVNTFITVAEDCRSEVGTVPPAGERPTLARLMWELLTAVPPYSLTSDDLLFAVHVARTGVGQDDRVAAKKAFLAQPVPCLRSSPLPRTYGWGIHFDATGRVALYGRETEEYRRFSAPGATTSDGQPIVQERALRADHDEGRQRAGA